MACYYIFQNVFLVLLETKLMTVHSEGGGEMRALFVIDISIFLLTWHTTVFIS